MGKLWMEDVPNMFAHGLEGYTDDRIAEGPGWISFDVGSIRCPLIVLHGADDVIADVVHARNNAAIIPGAELRLIDGLGHFSIQDELVRALTDLQALVND
jgi:pimeloyl-ACP methyl ester carboxylesterase